MGGPAGGRRPSRDPVGRTARLPAPGAVRRPRLRLPLRAGRPAGLRQRGALLLRDVLSEARRARRRQPRGAHPCPARRRHEQRRPADPRGRHRRPRVPDRPPDPAGRSCRGRTSSTTSSWRSRCSTGSRTSSRPGRTSSSTRTTRRRPPPRTPRRAASSGSLRRRSRRTPSRRPTSRSAARSFRAAIRRIKELKDLPVDQLSATLAAEKTPGGKSYFEIAVDVADKYGTLQKLWSLSEPLEPHLSANTPGA